MNDDMNDDINDEEFNNEDDRKYFESFYKNYMRNRKSVKSLVEFQQWLSDELMEHQYAVLPEKYSGKKNFPVCIVVSKMLGNYTFLYMLN